MLLLVLLLLVLGGDGERECAQEEMGVGKEKRLLSWNPTPPLPATAMLWRLICGSWKVPPMSRLCLLACIS